LKNQDRVNVPDQLEFTEEQGIDSV